MSGFRTAAVTVTLAAATFLASCGSSKAKSDAASADPQVQVQKATPPGPQTRTFAGNDIIVDKSAGTITFSPVEGTSYDGSPWSIHAETLNCNTGSLIVTSASTNSGVAVTDLTTSRPRSLWAAGVCKKNGLTQNFVNE